MPPEAREHVRVELEQERQAVNIVERRPPWREDYGPEWSRLPIARLRYVASKRFWTLYYHRHTGRWERYPLLGPSRRVADLLSEVAEDPICAFWGLTAPARRLGGPARSRGPRAGLLRRRGSGGPPDTTRPRSSGRDRLPHGRSCLGLPRTAGQTERVPLPRATRRATAERTIPMVLWRARRRRSRWRPSDGRGQAR
jgi:hypothetical protein